MTYQVLLGYVKQGQKLKKPSEHLWVCLRVSVIAFAVIMQHISLQ